MRDDGLQARNARIALVDRAIALSVKQGKTYHEVAEKLGIKQGTHGGEVYRYPRGMGRFASIRGRRPAIAASA